MANKLKLKFDPTYGATDRSTCNRCRRNDLVDCVANSNLALDVRPLSKRQLATNGCGPATLATELAHDWWQQRWRRQSEAGTYPGVGISHPQEYHSDAHCTRRACFMCVFDFLSVWRRHDSHLGSED